MKLQTDYRARFGRTNWRDEGLPPELLEPVAEQSMTAWAARFFDQMAHGAQAEAWRNLARMEGGKESPFLRGMEVALPVLLDHMDRCYALRDQYFERYRSEASAGSDGAA